MAIHKNILRKSFTMSALWGVAVPVTGIGAYLRKEYVAAFIAVASVAGIEVVFSQLRAMVRLRSLARLVRASARKELDPADVERLIVALSVHEAVSRENIDGASIAKILTSFLAPGRGVRAPRK
ncbi:hypothetical protein GCM10023195_82950 [Actinoallomurus liliacearum]|uniref:Uncharacterized protein n=1 Tax=Actinoallomurus liliacearum TaxID=1080073 RepID=A0ABP8U0W8_9ACTN